MSQFDLEGLTWSESQRGNGRSKMHQSKQKEYEMSRRSRRRRAKAVISIVWRRKRNIQKIMITAPPLPMPSILLLFT